MNKPKPPMTVEHGSSYDDPTFRNHIVANVFASVYF